MMIHEVVMVITEGVMVKAVRVIVLDSGIIVKAVRVMVIDV